MEWTRALLCESGREGGLGRHEEANLSRVNLSNVDVGLVIRVHECPNHRSGARQQLGRCIQTRHVPGIVRGIKRYCSHQPLGRVSQRQHKTASTFRIPIKRLQPVPVPQEPSAPGVVWVIATVEAEDAVVAHNQRHRSVEHRQQSTAPCTGDGNQCAFRKVLLAQLWFIHNGCTTVVPCVPAARVRTLGVADRRAACECSELRLLHFREDVVCRRATQATGDGRRARGSRRA
eukprot:3779474-Prymnesium_polylepis.1